MQNARQSLVGYLIETQGNIMQRVTGAKTDTLADLQSKSKFGPEAETQTVLGMYKASQTEIEALKGQLAQAQADAERARQDQVNEALLMRPGIHLTRSLVYVDGKGVDGAAGGLAALVGGTSARLRKVQNGFARSYALTMLAGVVAILGALWVIS